MTDVLLPAVRRLVEVRRSHPEYCGGRIASLAALLPFSRSTLSNYECGYTVPDGEALRAWAARLGVAVAEDEVRSVDDARRVRGSRRATRWRTPNPPFLDGFSPLERRVMRWRWLETDGRPACPNCGSLYWYYLADEKRAARFSCRDCDHNYSLLAGTPFHSSKLSLHKVARAIELLAEPEWPSIGYLAEQLGVSYRSAWYIYHRMPDPKPRLKTEGLGRPSRGVAVEEIKLAEAKKKLASERRVVESLRSEVADLRKRLDTLSLEKTNIQADVAVAVSAALEKSRAERDRAVRAAYARGVEEGRRSARPFISVMTRTARPPGPGAGRGTVVELEDLRPPLGRSLTGSSLDGM